MRWVLGLSFAILASSLFPSARADDPSRDQTKTLEYIASLRDGATGAYRVIPDGPPSLRACNGAIKALKYLGGKLPDKEKTAAFVLACHDPVTGGFAEPGGKPDVVITSIGVMAACELGIPREKFARAMPYLAEHARTFEEVRIAAAAVEAWGVRDCPFDLTPWVKIADDQYALWKKDSLSVRDAGSLAAFYLRLGKPLLDADALRDQMRQGQFPDGGYGKPGAKTSDLETTYRVMRSLMLLKEKPADGTKLKAFLAQCRNADGGYGVTPGAASSMSGVYYMAMVQHWLKPAR